MTRPYIDCIPRHERQNNLILDTEPTSPGQVDFITNQTGHRVVVLTLKQHKTGHNQDKITKASLQMTRVNSAVKPRSGDRAATGR
jgi:hypothetical protein